MIMAVETVGILVSAALVNNFVLSGFLGLCPLFGASGRRDAAAGIVLATIFVLTLSSGACYLLHHYLLQPYQLEYLRTLVFILVIAGLVQTTELVIRKMTPLLHKVLGLYLPLVTTNCMVLGVALISAERAQSFIQAAAVGLGAAAGFGIVLMVFSSLRERLQQSAVPAVLQGPGIAMLTAGIMSMAFMGFSGVTDGVIYGR